MRKVVIKKILIAVGIVILLAACSNSQNDDNDDVVELTWFVNDANAAWKNYEGTVNEQYLIEHFGVKLKFVTPVTDDNAQLNAMIAGDSLTDLISVQSWFPETRDLADQGYLYSMNELMDKYDPDMWNIMQEDVFGYFQRPDGKTYGLPNYAYSNKYLQGDAKLAPNGAILIRKDYQEWYLEQNPNGSDPAHPDYISKPEGFIKMAKAVKEQFYKTGEPVIQLEHGLSQSINWLSQYFAVPFEKEDGSFQQRELHPLMKETRQFVNRLFNLGLISESNLSDNRDQVANNISTGKPFVTMVTPQDYQNEFWNAYDTHGIEYEAFVLRNSHGDQPVLQDIRGFGYLLTMVSKKTKHPEKVTKLLHFLYSEEGQRFVTWGLEGETWEWEEKPSGDSFGKIRYTDEYVQALENDDTEKYGLGLNLLANYAYLRLVEPKGNMEPRMKYIENLKLPLSPYTTDYNAAFFQVDSSDPDYAAYRDNEGKLEAVWDQYKGVLVMTDKFEEEYDKVLELLKKEGLEFNTEMASKYYVQWKERLGYDHGWSPNDSSYKEEDWMINGDPSWKYE